MVERGQSKIPARTKSATADGKVKMKVTNKVLIAAVASIALLTFAGSARAQYKPTGDDGITASPRLRAQLDERNARLNPVAAVAAPTMACPMCKDEWVVVPDRLAKGAQILASGAPVKRIARHLCAGCETTVTTQGLSKQTRTEVVIHKCTGCGAENLACCSTTPGHTVATKGMETFQVAPLK